MVTIRRHPVPTDSYDPKRPLNDLLVAQFDHFIHIAEALPPEVRSAIPATPSPDDREAVDRFIAAITGSHVSRKMEKPRLVKPARRRQPGTLETVAATAGKPKSPKWPGTKTKAKPSGNAGPKQ
jgi:hypothetical protein